MSPSEPVDRDAEWRAYQARFREPMALTALASFATNPPKAWEVAVLTAKGQPLPWSSEEKATQPMVTLRHRTKPPSPSNSHLMTIKLSDCFWGVDHLARPHVEHFERHRFLNPGALFQVRTDAVRARWARVQKYRSKRGHQPRS